MANYFVLQENDESAAYAFKVKLDGYRFEPRKNSREQFTVTGTLDVQSGPNDFLFSYVVKVSGVETGNFVTVPGVTMTAASVDWGDYEDLKSLFANDVPPDNKLRFRDVDGTEYYVFFTGSMRPVLLTTIPSGSGAYLEVAIVLRGSAS